MSDPYADDAMWERHDRQLEKADAFAHDGWPTVEPLLCFECETWKAVLDGRCGLCEGRRIAKLSGGDRNAGPARLADRPKLTLIRSEL